MKAKCANRYLKLKVNSCFNLVTHFFIFKNRGRSWILPTSRMESFATIVNGEKPLTIVTKLHISDVFEGPGCTYENNILN